MTFLTIVAIIINDSQLTALTLAIIVSLMIEFIIGWRLRFGIFGLLGAIITALFGIWIIVFMIKITIPNDPKIDDVPIIASFIGSILFVALWHLLTLQHPKKQGRSLHSRKRKSRY